MVVTVSLCCSSCFLLICKKPYSFQLLVTTVYWIQQSVIMDGNEWNHLIVDVLGKDNCE